MIFVCEKCGLRQRIEADEFPMLCICKTLYQRPPLPAMPSLTKRLSRYGRALIGHLTNGRPKRTDSEVSWILETHCKPCRYFDGQNCRHAQCGCRVNDGHSAITNKIRMATQSCPISLWGPESRPNGQVTVGFVTPGLVSAGAEWWTTWMTRACDQSAVRVEFVLQVSGKDRTDPALAAAIRKTCPIYHDAQLPKKVLDKTDVIIAWGGGNIPRSLDSFGGQLVFVNHASTDKARAIVGKALLNGYDHFVAVSDKAAEYMPRESRCTVLHNGIDLDRCSPIKGRKATRKRWRVAKDDICIGFLGRPHADKHPDLLARACEVLPTRYRPVFIGQFGDYQKRAMADICSRSVFVDHSPHIGDALASLDGFVLISDHEAMNLATCEAWAAGVPVVTTPVGAVPELERRHGRLCVTVPVGSDAMTVAEAVERALSDGNRMAVERAARVVHDHYTLEAMGRRWATYLLAVKKAAIS